MSSETASLLEDLVVAADSVCMLARQHRNIFPHVSEESLVAKIWKETSLVAPPHQGLEHGRKEHPFNMAAAIGVRRYNSYHSTCLETKINATAGLGFRDPDVAKKLKPVTKGGARRLLRAVADDYWNLRNAYIEVIRDESGRITGLHHLPAPCVHIVLENDDYDTHFEIDNGEGSTPRVFAQFGERDDLIGRAAKNNVRIDDPRTVSEVIQFSLTNSEDRWYGIPAWLGATPWIELSQMLTQHMFDFFLNRGVPEVLMMVLGASIGDGDWKAIQEKMKAHIGLTNSHKSMALNLPSVRGPEAKVQIEKLALDSKTDGQFESITNLLSLLIVGSHQTPPLLVGIQTPGKLGATNEFPNALMSFHVLTTGPVQRDFSETLADTLGDPDLNGGLGLTAEDFLPPAAKDQMGIEIPGTAGNAFRTVIEEIDINKADVIAQMRQTLPEAAAEGRDLNKGLKK